MRSPVSSLLFSLIGFPSVHDCHSLPQPCKLFSNKNPFSLQSMNTQSTAMEEEDSTKGERVLTAEKNPSATKRSINLSSHSDIIAEVDNVVFHLHNFPRHSRSGLLNRLVGSRGTNEIKLVGFPGGADAFDEAIKFCYESIEVEINSSNVGALRCAADYLEMTESVDEGNLIARTEEFLQSVWSESWLDTVIVLRSCKELGMWAEKLSIPQRCMEAVALMVSTDSSRLTWSFTQARISPRHAHLYPPRMGRSDSHEICEDVISHEDENSNTTGESSSVEVDSVFVGQKGSHIGEKLTHPSFWNNLLGKRRVSTSKNRRLSTASEMSSVGDGMVNDKHDGKESTKSKWFPFRTRRHSM